MSNVLKQPIKPIWYRLPAWLRTVLMLCLGVYGVICAFMFFNQRSFIYQPNSTEISPASAGFLGAETLHLHTRDGQTLIAWYKPAQENKPIFLYFHGQSGSLVDSVATLNTLTSDGHGILAVDYRGYGGSSGVPTQTGLMNDAEEAYEALLAREYWPNRIIVYGFSLGVAPATHIAAVHKVAALILEGSYSSGLAVAHYRFPYLPNSLLMLDKLLIDQEISKVKSPILFLHGGKDPIVPIHLARALFDVAPNPKSMVEVPEAQHFVLNQPGVATKVREWLIANLTGE